MTGMRPLRRGLRTVLAVLAVAGTVAVPTRATADISTVAASPSFDAVVDLTFPVVGTTSYTDSFDAPRGGGTRVHTATDIMADYGQAVHAAVGGTISWITGLTTAPPSYGYMITIDGDDGRQYSYIHLGRQDAGPDSAYAPDLSRGVRVERGQRIGTVGCSGNASCSAPHLHFEISDDRVTDPYGGHRMNPYPSLVAAEGRGDYPGAQDGRPEEASCEPVGTVPATPVRRLSADNPVATSVVASRVGWTTAAEVLVATADDFADALAGAALAANRGAPLLLVGDTLGAATREELARLGPQRVTVLGGSDAVPDAVVAAIAEAVPVVERIAGDDRFATAAVVQQHVGDGGGEVVLALGRHQKVNRSWPDAISAGALATGPAPLPVLLTRDDRIPSITVDALADARAAGVTTVLIVGGSDAINEGVESQVGDLGFAVRRLEGPTRYQTSLEVLKAAQERVGEATTLVTASGTSFADAVLGGPLAAQVGGTLLLVPPCNLDSVPRVASYIAGRYGDGYVIGAEGAVSERVREVLTNAITG